MNRTLGNSDFDIADEVSTFLATVVDVLCSDKDSEKLAAEFKLHPKLTSLFLTRFFASFLTNEIIFKLQREMKRLEIKIRNVFQNYQAPMVRTKKFHNLNHVADSIPKAQGAQYVPARIIWRKHWILDWQY